VTQSATEPIECAQCGALLPIRIGATGLTCLYCSAALQVSAEVARRMQAIVDERRKADRLSKFAERARGRLERSTFSRLVLSLLPWVALCLAHAAVGAVLVGVAMFDQWGSLGFFLVPMAFLAGLAVLSGVALRGHYVRLEAALDGVRARPSPAGDEGGFGCRICGSGLGTRDRGLQICAHCGAASLVDEAVFRAGEAALRDDLTRSRRLHSAASRTLEVDFKGSAALYAFAVIAWGFSVGFAGDALFVQLPRGDLGDLVQGLCLSLGGTGLAAFLAWVIRR